MKLLPKFTATGWRTPVLAASALAAVGIMYLFRLGSVTRGLLSSRELHTHTDYQSLHNILKDPINAPYKLLDFLTLQLQAHSAAYARLTSVLLALIACALFFIIVYRWHGKRSAILATAMFSTSGWMLHTGRLGTTDILPVIIPLSIILLASWVINTERHGLALLFMTLVAGLAFYTPGAIWFLIVGYLLIGKSIISHVRHAKLWVKLACLAASLILAGFLAYAIYRDVSLLRSWLFLPASFPSPLTILHQWADAFLFLFVRGPSQPDVWLAHTPVLDIFASAMCLIGARFYITHYKNLRTHTLASLFVLGSILVALNGTLALGYLIPVAYLLAATGITYLLHKWLTVFPRNPIARGIGVIMIFGVVIAAIGYHTTSYFVAWRHSPTTVQAFTHQP